MDDRACISKLKLFLCEYSIALCLAIISFPIQLQLRSSFPSPVGRSCEVRNVGPFPPDPVTDLQLVSISQQFSLDSKFVTVTIQFNWTSPEFAGEGIVGYQVWLDRLPATDDVTRNITHGALDRSAEIEMQFAVEDDSFYLVLQVCIHMHVY